VGGLALHTTETFVGDGPEGAGVTFVRRECGGPRTISFFLLEVGFLVSRTLLERGILPPGWCAHFFC
jgi:hypothetical protein